MHRIRTLMVLALFAAAPASGGEIGFVEDFVLAGDRAKALEQLVPGTEDFYYFHSLHYLATEQYAKVVELQAPWLERHGESQRLWEIRTRHALLTYDRAPQASLDYLIRRTGVQFNHQREDLSAEPNLPTKLDPELISRAQFQQRAVGISTDNVNGFENDAIDWLIQTPLHPNQRRDLLGRLTRPDYPKLVDLIVADLNHENSGGFGSLGIHTQLLLTQLEELAKKKPELLNHQAFVNAYLKRLQPSADEDWRHDPKLLEAYLIRLSQFAKRLGPVHNSLKAHVLYHQLVLDQQQGKLNRERFLAYLQLPRPVGYAAESFLKSESIRRFPCDLNRRFIDETLFPVIGDDEPLVRSHLLHFLKELPNAKEFEPFVNDVYLKYLLAEAKIVNGLGTPEQWAALLPPEIYQRLKERIDIDFAPTNPTQFAVDQPVVLDVAIKNVPTLIVKVFEVNTGSLYRETLRQVGTDINLDGLIANIEQTHVFKDPPVRRVTRRFEFPQLNKAGVYVIDFIGNGRSSRALIRKGRLSPVVRTGPVGQVFTIYDETQKPVNDASIWLAGREYPADEQGAITVPFSTTPGRQSIVISRGDFSCLDSFAHEAENYTLSAGMYVDRESLLSRRQATVLIRPGLRLNGALASVQLLTQPKLLITSTDLDGISTSDQINDVALFDDRETVHEFQVPARTASISFVLTAKVNRVSAGGAPFDLSTVTGFTLNGIEQTDKTEDLHLVPSDTGYVVALLGKTGEPKGGRAIHLSLKHRDFRDLFLTTLKTTPQGRVELGELADITSVTATGPQGMTETWPLRPDRTTSSPQLNGKEGEPVVVPFVPRAEGELSPAEVSLLELRGNAFVADRFRNLKQRDGLLVIEGLPAGNFDLWLKSSDTQIHLRIAAGAKDRRFVLGKTRILETPAMPPLQVAAIEKTPEALKVKLANATKLTRVHVFADRFAPAYSAFDSLASVGTIEPKQFSRLIASSVYITGRNIGDEYSYIFNRKYAAKLPGNMLERPALLLNPWGVRETETGEQQASQADDFAGVDSLRRELEMGIPTDSPASPPPPPGTSQFSNLDFLASGSTVLVNLTADDDGTVTIPLAELGAHQHIHIVAVDALSTAYRSVALPEPDLLVIDQRLLFPLDPEKHFSQQKQISVIAPGTPFEIADVTTSRFETYDSLARVYALFATLSGDTQLAEFGPILTWPTMTPEARRAFYSKHASHELTFFLAKKDPEFFQTVIKPYLANKRDKTFLDHWLLEEDLREYLQPWNFGQLNVVERILVARRIEADRQATARHIADLYSLLPPDRDRFTRLFDTAIKGRALSSNEELEELLSASMEVEPTDETGDALAERQDRGGRVMSSFKSKRSAGLGQGGGMGGGGFFGGGTGRMTVGMGGMPAAPGEMERFSKQLDDVELKQEPVEEQAKSQRGEANERSSLRSKSGAARRKMPQKKFLKESLRDADDSDSDGDEPVSDVAEYLDYDLAITLPTDSIRSLYRQPDPTKEWAENNYHHLTIDEQMSDLITVNAFWRDFAQHDPAQPFVSAHLAEASGNFPEMLLALAVLDLPFEAPKHETKLEGTRLTISPAGPAVVYHEEIRAADPAPGPAKILVGQSYFKHGDRHMQVDGEQVDKYVTDEFLIHTVYGCQVVVTNPSSTRQNLSLLLQIPQGAIPVLNTRRTRTQLITLEPYHTQTIDYHFYFPAAGEFQHFPVQVARNADLVAFAAPTTLHVVEKPVKVDAESWDHVSQFGSSEEVVAFLTKQNCDRLDLDRIAWRMNDARFFETVTRLLASRHAYNQTLWSYALKHNAVPAINDLLQHADPLVTECGGRLRSRLLTIDPVARRTYEHLEYKPLVNARAHALGKRRQIVNDRFHQQYHLWLAQAAYDRELSPDDLLTATYYLLLQDRVEEARSTFRRVKPEQIASRMQYDYCAAYLDFFNAEPAQARAIALKYTDHPVDRWRNTFAAIVAQLDEAEGKETQVVDATSRDQQQSQLAATEPSFEFKVEAKEIELSYQNLDQVRVSYYLMDVELLFSRNPFVRQFRGQFSAVKPNQTALVSLKPADAPDEKPASGTMRIPLPKELLNKNILVEITGAGENRTQAYYSHSLGVQVIENYGQVRVTQATTEKPVSKAYVKVYTRTAGGEVKFFKDGYTDLRGRFDYASLSTNDLDGAVKFAILILSDEHGAVVKEADPPKR